MKPLVSIIVPVYNRPAEVEELLQSIYQARREYPFEIVIVEDGSYESCEDVCSRFCESLPITYHFKKNTGPGDSRNYGMSRAKADVFVLMDSDCLIPTDYFETLESFLSNRQAECFGGTDRAHPSFTPLQKAIDFSMTSFLTTGGVRGYKSTSKSFQPRSFNMGLTRRAFEITGGFSNLHPGEDPELVLKLWGKGLSTALVENWYVYHKRRMSWSKFAKQMSKFGKARIILNHDFPKYRKLVFWFPLFFSAGLILALGLLFVPLYFLGCLYLTYFMLVGISGTLKHGVKVGIYAILATIIQFVSYAQGFATAFVKINILSREPINALPELFFDAKN